ncbi:M16 family metallopeptidase [Mesonia mobilis]|uniref:M16 family metallopeptidase n=1 Tax=Mesonia mobilis TaxID=369791 RepID=UPI0026EB6661|nr:insulinase family protein [Mesonia mobilis]
MKYFITYVLLLSINFYSNAFDKSYPKDSLALDPSITYGKLNNGFQYYIKPTSNAKQNLEIRFLVKAGFNQEDEDQYTLSHFMEHIALKAGKNVSTRLLYGSKLANDLNIGRGAITAYTAREYTEYIVRIPNTTKAKKFAFQLLDDIMQGLEFKDAYIESERSPFMDESEVRGGASSIAVKKFLLESEVIGCGAMAPVDYQNYIEHFKKDKLIRFYKDWYRPDLMGVMITGGIQDINSLENELNEWFTEIPNPVNPRIRKSCIGTTKQDKGHFYQQERERNYKDQYEIDLYYELYFQSKSLKNNNSVTGLENRLKEEIISKVLHERLKLLKETENWPFEAIAVFSDGSSFLNVQVKTQEGNSKKAICQTMNALEQFRKYGVLKEELIKIKNRILPFFEQPDSKSYWNSEIRKHFLNQEALPAHKKEFLKNYLDQLTVKEINDYLRENYDAMPSHVGLIAPKAHPTLDLEQDTIRSWMSEGLRQEVSNFKIPAIPNSIIDSKVAQNLKAHRYTSLPVNITNAKKYKLANGLQLILKPLAKDDYMSIPKGEIRFLGMRQKGAFCFSEEDYFSAINAPQIVYDAGVSNIDRASLNRYLKSKDPYLYAMPYIHNQETGIQGQATMKTLETALQLVYLYFTDPNKNDAAFKRWERANPSENLEDVNQKDFRTQIELALGHKNFLPTGSFRMQGVSKTDFDRAYTIYQNLFGKASEFTFIFSGDFDQQKVLELSNKYLGNLPNIQDLICNKNLYKKDFFENDLQSEVWVSPNKMNNTLVNIYYRTKITSETDDWKEKIKLEFLANLMDVSLMRRLRLESEQGGPYSIHTIYNHDASNFFHELVIIYSCQPQDQERLSKEIESSIKFIQRDLFSEAMFETTKQEFLSLQRENNYNRLQKIATHLRENNTWYTQDELIAFIKSLSPNDIKEISQTYLNGSPRVFKMNPKKDENRLNNY